MNNDLCRYISMTSFELRYRYKTTSNKLMFEAVAGTILSCDHFLLTIVNMLCCTHFLSNTWTYPAG